MNAVRSFLSYYTLCFNHFVLNMHLFLPVNLEKRRGSTLEWLVFDKG